MRLIYLGLFKIRDTKFKRIAQINRERLLCKSYVRRVELKGSATDGRLFSISSPPPLSLALLSRKWLGPRAREILRDSPLSTLNI